MSEKTADQLLAEKLNGAAVAFEEAVNECLDQGLSVEVPAHNGSGGQYSLIGNLTLYRDLSEHLEG